MPGRGPQSQKKRQKEQQRRERQQEKLAKRLSRKRQGPDDPSVETSDEPLSPTEGPLDTVEEAGR